MVAIKSGAYERNCFGGRRRHKIAPDDPGGVEAVAAGL